MTRQMMLVWSGQSRWSDHAAEHGAAGHGAAGHGAPEHDAGDQVDGHEGDPHEPPRTMLFPILLLGVLSTIGWLINAPFGGLDYLTKWLAPVFPTTIAPAITLSTSTKLVLILVALAFSLGGLVAGAYAWRRAVYRPALEPAVLAHGWYIDEGIASAVSGPLAKTASAFSFGVDLGFFDGMVNGVGRLAAGTGRQLRRMQTGYVRNYALGIGLGAVAVLFYFALRAGG
jgi:NADH-quinone oxidoreductase subunit L